MTVARRGAPATPLRLSSRTRAVLRAASRPNVVLPLLALCGYAVAVAVRGGALSNAMFFYGDAPEGAYLGAAVLAGHIRLPLHTELVASLIEGAFLHAPGAHVLIQLLGPALAVTAGGLAALAVHRLGGAWWLTAATSVALGPASLWTTLFPTAHVYTLVCLAAVALAVIALVRGRLLPWHAVLIGVVSGSAVISDQGFVIEGLVPLVLVLAWRGFCRDWTGVRSGALIVASTVATTLVITAWLFVSGIHVVIELVPGATAINTPASSVNSIVHAFAAMASGTMFGADPSQPFGVVAALAGVAIPLAAPATLLATLRRRRHADAAIAYLLFWTAADVIIITAFVVFGYGGPPLQGHYLLPCLFSAVATFPLLFTKRIGAAVAIVAAVVLVQAAGVMTVPVRDFGSSQESARVLAAIKAQGLTRGYAGYWLSHPVTWLSGESVHVYPVEHFYCGSGGLCPYEYTSDVWYRPVSGRTFLVVTRDDSCVRTAPASLGTPLKVIPIDAEATLIVFDYDIAADFGPVPTHIC